MLWETPLGGTTSSGPQQSRSTIGVVSRIRGRGFVVGDMRIIEGKKSSVFRS